MGNKFVTQIRKTFRSSNSSKNNSTRIDNTNKNQLTIDVVKKSSLSLNNDKDVDNDNDDDIINSLYKWSMLDEKEITGVDSLGNFQRCDSRKDASSSSSTKPTNRVSVFKLHSNNMLLKFLRKNCVFSIFYLLYLIK